MSVGAHSEASQGFSYVLIEGRDARTWEESARKFTIWLVSKPEGTAFCVLSAKGEACIFGSTLGWVAALGALFLLVLLFAADVAAALSAAHHDRVGPGKGWRSAFSHGLHHFCGLLKALH